MDFIPSEPPPLEDSNDLTDEEVERALDTESEDDLAKKLAGLVSPGQASVGKSDARYALKRYELRRRNPDLFWRVHLGCPGEPDKVLVYRVNWYARGQEYESKQQ